MKTIIAGTRGIADYALVAGAIERSGFDISQVLSGRARGVDAIGELWAKSNDVPVVAFLPDWERYGRGAGLKRNTQMAEAADALLAVWDGKSRGTAHMVSEAKRLGLHIYLVVTDL